jgi:sec-independent protein translocase protein TatB
MFDFGFWELVLVFIVALLVIGPERLPGVARKVGLWVGKAKRFVTSVRSDIERELRAEELREMLNKQQSEIEQLRGMLEETQAEVREELEETDSLVQAIEEQIERSAEAAPRERAAPRSDAADVDGDRKPASAAAVKPAPATSAEPAPIPQSAQPVAADDGKSADRT